MAFDAIDHGKTVLAAILQGRETATLDIALRHLTTEHFPDPQQRMFFQLCERYLADYGQIMPREALGFILREEPPGTLLQYQEYYDLLLAWSLDGLALAASIDALREATATRLTGEALAQGMAILNGGAHHGRDLLRGHEDARNWVLSQFAALDRELRLAEAPEGDMRTEAQDLMAIYNERREAALTRRGVVSTGFGPIDKALGGGFWPGELNLVAAYTNGGKTSFAVHLAWHACVVQGKNVVIFTSETLRTQIRFKLLARHSVHLCQEAGQRGLARAWTGHGLTGLDTRALKEGKLKDAEVALLHDTITHFADKPAHGRCYVAQVPRGATIGTLESRLSRITRMFPADLVVVDYLALLRPGIKRNTRREELAETVVEAKAMATTYLNGVGVPVVSPWQVNREGWKEAKQRGFYTTADIAETAEASSTSDDILTLLDEPNVPDSSNGRAAPVLAQLIKVRDGEKLGAPLRLTADYGTCHFTARQRATTDTEDIEVLAQLENEGL